MGKKNGVILQKTKQKKLTYEGSRKAKKKNSLGVIAVCALGLSLIQV